MKIQEQEVFVDLQQAYCGHELQAVFEQLPSSLNENFTEYHWTLTKGVVYRYNVKSTSFLPQRYVSTVISCRCKDESEYHVVTFASIADRNIYNEVNLSIRTVKNIGESDNVCPPGAIIGGMVGKQILRALCVENIERCAA